MLENGKRKKMSDLKVGDSVLTVDENGGLTYSPIILHLHRSLRETGNFLSITTNTGQSINLTPQHLVYRKTKVDVKDEMKKHYDINSFRAVFASIIKEGDWILVYDTHTTLRMSRVINVEKNFLVGLFSPLTFQGSIVVDGVLASCYSDFDSHEIQHLSFAPFRWIYNFLNYIPSLKYKHDDEGIYSNQDGEGVYWYGQGLHFLAKLLYPEKLWEHVS